MDVYNTSIWLDSTKWEIGSLSGIAFCESIEEGRFTDIWESDDSEVHNGKNKAKAEARELLYCRFFLLFATICFWGKNRVKFWYG